MDTTFYCYVEIECELVLLNKESIVLILLPLLAWIKSFWKRGLAHGLPHSLIWLPFRHATMKVAGFCLSPMTKDIATNWLLLPGLLILFWNSGLLMDSFTHFDLYLSFKRTILKVTGYYLSKLTRDIATLLPSLPGLFISFWQSELIIFRHFCVHYCSDKIIVKMTGDGTEHLKSFIYNFFKRSWSGNFITSFSQNLN